MHFFVVAASRTGEPVAEEIVQRFDKIDLSELPFSPDQHLTWRNRSGSVRFAGWQSFGEIGQIKSHWHADHQELAGFSGLPLWWNGSWPAVPSWASHLHSQLKSLSPKQITDQLVGMFTMYRLSKFEEGYIGSDGLSAGMLYAASIGDVIIISNLASLAAHTLTYSGGAITRDWNGPGWLLYAGQALGLETGFAGVTVLPQGAYLHIDERGRADIQRHTETPWDDEPFVHCELAVEEAIEQFNERLHGTIRALAAAPFSRREFRLSGGKDSRLLLSIICNEGLQDRFSFLTYGLPDSPDVLVAHDVAQQWGIDLAFDDRSELSVDQLRDEQLLNAALTHGTVSGWDAKSGTLAFDTMRIGGSNSGAVRTDGLLLKLYQSSAPYKDFLLRPEMFDRFGLLNPKHRNYYRNAVSAFVDEESALLPDPRDFASVVFAINGSRRWTGPNTEIGSSPWAYPYFDRALLALNLSLAESDRVSEKIPFQIMRRNAPGLELIPFASSSWADSAWESSTGDNPPPPRIKSSGRKSPQWRVRSFSLHREIFLSYLADKTNPVFEIADYDAIHALLNVSEPGYQQVKTAYSVLTAALWLGRHDKLERIRRPNDPDLSTHQRQALRNPLHPLPPTSCESLDTTELSQQERSELQVTAPPLSSDARICALIPHFEAERFLADALDSLVNQTRKLDAIVVIDDCSPEPPIDISRQFPEVTLLRATEPSGPYRLIQEVIDSTDFDAYLFQDADDWSADTRLEVLLNHAERTGAELIGSQGFRLIEGEDEVVTYSHALDPAGALRDRPTSKPIHHPTTLASRDLILRAGGFGTGFRYSGDTEFLRRASFVGNISNVPDMLYFYRTRKDSLTGSDETGNHTPVRRQLWELQHARAELNAARAVSGAAPILAPMSMTGPVVLEHLAGPSLEEIGNRSNQPTVAKRRQKRSTPSIRETLPKPVFVIGAPRSGDSLLASCILQHSNFKEMLEPGWLFDLAASLQRVYEESAIAAPPTSLSIAGAELETFLAHFGSAANDLILQGIDGRLAPLFGDDSEVLSGNSRLTSTATYRRFVCGDAAAIPFAFSLHRLFPHARFIHVMRDPDEVAKSLTTDNSRWYRSKFVSMSEEEAFDLWMDRVNACLRVEKAFGSSHVLRIDRNALIKDGEATMKQVCGFLDEPYEKAVLRPLH